MVFGAGGMAGVVKGWKWQRERTGDRIKVSNSQGGFGRAGAPQGFLDNPRHPQNPLGMWEMENNTQHFIY